MAWAASYAYVDSAAVMQTWNRVSIGPDSVKYVNDTARALGVDQFFVFNISTTNKTVGGVKIPVKRWNCKLSTRIVATETEPLTINFTLSLTEVQSNAVATTRVLFKNLKIAMLFLSDADSEIDDITACRLL